MAVVTGGRLTALSDGRPDPAPDAGPPFGPAPDCDVVLASLRASRRHARVVPGALGYSLVDTSTNGVVVNGARVDGTAVLKQLNIIGIREPPFGASADGASGETD